MQEIRETYGANRIDITNIEILERNNTSAVVQFKRVPVTARTSMDIPYTTVTLSLIKQ